MSSKCHLFLCFQFDHHLLPPTDKKFQCCQLWCIFPVSTFFSFVFGQTWAPPPSFPSASVLRSFVVRRRFFAGTTEDEERETGLRFFLLLLAINKWMRAPRPSSPASLGRWLHWPWPSTTTKCCQEYFCFLKPFATLSLRTITNFLWLVCNVVISSAEGVCQTELQRCRYYSLIRVISLKHLPVQIKHSHTLRAVIM